MRKSEAMSVPWEDLRQAIQTNPNRAAAVSRPSAASTSILAIPDHANLNAIHPDWYENQTITISDAIAFVLWAKDPMYRIASMSVCRAMEMEEASSLLMSIEEGWHRHNGRARGWVRKHLEEDLRGRSSGADANPDFWDTMRTSRRAALLVDYICVMRGVRFCFWWSEHKQVTTLPLTMGILDAAATRTPYYMMDCLSGHCLEHVSTPPTDVTSIITCLKKDYTWTAPASSPTLGSHTVAQLQERLQAVNPIADCKGSRPVIWTRLMLETLLRDLRGETPVGSATAEVPESP